MQNFEIKSKLISDQFEKIKREKSHLLDNRLTLSWSIWMFGIEKFEDSVKRLKKNDINYIELKGDRHTQTSGVPSSEIKKVLADYEMKVSGACGMFSQDNDLSSTDATSVKAAQDYIKRQLDFLAEVGAKYMVVVPSAVGRPNALAGDEFARSVEALKACAPYFKDSGIFASVEPIRAAEVSLVHTVKDAMKLIEAIDDEAIAHINADTYHMMLEEAHIGQAIIEAGDRLCNLHVADSNRGALGTGMTDFDTIIRAAYIIGMNTKDRFITPEPLGPFPNPYVLANSPCNVPVMDKLVKDTAAYFRQREEVVLG
jgi:D-psicose/D-tagatose/L-ribulose 3-epimerase